MASLIVSLLPIRFKTLGYAIFGLVQLLIYSSGPEIVSIAQYRADVDPAGVDRYITVTRIILCVLIPFGYCACAVGLGWVSFSGRFSRDIKGVREAASYQAKIDVIKLSRQKQIGFAVGLSVLAALVIGLTATSYALGT